MYVCYATGVLFYFGVTGLKVFADTTGSLSPLIEWTWFPGGFLAGWTVGVHSDHFILGCLLWNIAVYLLVPFLVWKLVKSKNVRNTKPLCGR